MGNERFDARIEGSQLVIETVDDTELHDSRFVVAAALVYVAKSDGVISVPETEKMLQLIGGHFGLQSAESLTLLTRAIDELAGNPELPAILRKVSARWSAADKEDIALMMLKVVAADGHRDANELDAIRNAAATIAISPDTMHRAFDRYFADRPG